MSTHTEALCATPPTASNAGEREAFEPDRLESIIDDYLEDYEMRGEDEDGRDACHTPSDGERFLIKDAIMGLLADSAWDAEWGKHIDSMANRRAALASKPVAPPAREALSFNCSNGCGACNVKLIDFVTHATQAQDSDQWVTVASEPEIVSTCCGSAVEVWDERKQDIVGKVSATPPAQAVQTEDTQLLNWLRDECCDLRCISVPTGGDDYDVRWVVIQHHMAEPREREIGESFTDDPRDAIRAARTRGNGVEPS